MTQGADFIHLYKSWALDLCSKPRIILYNGPNVMLRVAIS